MRRLSPLRRLRNWVRGLWPDHNPLRRASDRAEAAIFAALLVAFLIAAPLASSFAGRWAAGSAMRAAQESRSRYQVTAVLLTDASAQSYGTPEALARWTTHDGARHTGKVNVPAGAVRGEHVKVWTDPSGTLTGPPVTAGQAAAQAAAARAFAPFVVALLLAAVGTLAHRLLLRRKLAAWGAEWRITGPRWTHQR
jgi:hypothetical protein